MGSWSWVSDYFPFSLLFTPDVVINQMNVLAAADERVHLVVHPEVIPHIPLGNYSEETMFLLILSHYGLVCLRIYPTRNYDVVEE